MRRRVIVTVAREISEPHADVTKEWIKLRNDLRVSGFETGPGTIEVDQDGIEWQGHP